jgi:hypothetical protein
MRVALKTKPLVISFEKTPDGNYQLVRDGDIDADTHFGFAFDMACKRLNISYKRRGYSGSATHSSSTFAFAQEVPEEALMAATVALAELPTAELARQLIEGGLFGPRADEPDFSQFDEHTDAETLKEWAIAYYQANSIDDPESLACLERNTLFRFRRVAVAALQHNLRGAYNTPIKVDAYRQILQRHIPMPPLICRRRGWELYEGYHRLAACVAESREKVACVVIGRT